MMGFCIFLCAKATGTADTTDAITMITEALDNLSGSDPKY